MMRTLAVDERDVVGRRGQPGRAAPAADRERDPARAEHEREHG